MFLKLPCHYQSLEYRLWLMWRSLKIYFLQMSDLGSRENWIEFSLNNHIGSRMAALVPISSKILLPTCFASKVVWFFYKLLKLFWNTLRSTFQLQKKCRYLINPYRMHQNAGARYLDFMYLHFPRTDCSCSQCSRRLILNLSQNTRIKWKLVS